MAVAGERCVGGGGGELASGHTMGGDLIRVGCALMFLGVVGVPVLLVLGIAIGANWATVETIVLVTLAVLGGIGLIRKYRGLDGGDKDQDE
jgi:hypothetical protein